MRLALVATVVVVAIPLALARAAPAADPTPLTGVSLQGATGVRLVAAHTTPFVFDVDSGRVTRLGALATPRGSSWVLGVAARAGVVFAGSVWRRGNLYAVRAEGTPRRLGVGMGAGAAPGLDGGSVWVERFLRPAHCTLRQVRLDGRVQRKPKPFRCVPELYPGGSLGVRVGGTRVIDPRTGKTVFKSPLDRVHQRLAILAVAGKKVLLQDGPGRLLTLLDTTTGARRTIDWPSNVGQLDTPAVDVGGRRIAVAFANPSWTGPPGQAFDVWILDTQTAELTHLPGMPAFVWLKWTNMAWTADGRLVLLTRDETRQMVVLWRPGQTQLHLKTVRLPNRNGVSSDTFAILGPM